MSEQSTQRATRKSFSGEVISRTGDRSLKVSFGFKTPHPLYGKEIKRRTVVHAHDEENACGVGDKVEIMETRPISKLKRWRVTRIIEKAPELEIAS